MTNTPGDDEQPQNPYDPYPPQTPQTPQQPPYGQAPYDQGSYGQPPYDQGSYGQPPYGQPPVGYAPDHPKATTAMVLGILGIVVCGLVAPFAWRIGKRTVDEIDASHGQLGGRGTAQAGYILGIIGTILLVLGLLIGLLVMVLAIAPLMVSSSNA
jgi:hypothetical protein